MVKSFESNGAYDEPAEADEAEPRFNPAMPGQGEFPVVPDDVLQMLGETTPTFKERVAAADSLHDAYISGLISEEAFMAGVEGLLPELADRAA